MEKHKFISEPCQWMGEGKIVLSMVEEQLPFSTSWNVLNKNDKGKIECSQGMHIQGFSDPMSNNITFFDFKNNSFKVEMNNPNVGTVIGTGVYDDKIIAWEFKNNELKFEGYELYLLQEDNSYSMQGEYITADQFRTHIEGKIWQNLPK